MPDVDAQPRKPRKKGCINSSKGGKEKLKEVALRWRGYFSSRESMNIAF